MAVAVMVRRAALWCGCVGCIELCGLVVVVVYRYMVWWW